MKVSDFILVLLVLGIDNGFCFELEVDQRDLFPYPANKSFGMYFVRKDKGVPLSESMADTMVVLVSDVGDMVRERAIFDYGFKEMIDQPFRGEYMTIPSWHRETRVGMNEEGINISVIFSRRANNLWLYVYQLEAKSPTERRQMLNNLQPTSTEARLLLKDQVLLLVPPRVELTIFSKDGRKNELMLGETASATCRAFEGMPPAEPVFLGLDDFDVEKLNFVQETNERKVEFKVSLFDHEKRLRCRAGETETVGTIQVLHHPSQVTLDPEPGPFLENGSSVLCLKADGYPAPLIRWTFISGPPNATLFFTLTESGTRFNLLKDAPLRSKWVLNCTSSNIIPSSTRQYNMTVSFTVARPQEGLFDRLNLTMQLIIGVVVVAVIVLFCTMIVVIICIVRRCCISHPSNTTRKNGGTIKASSKEKVGSSIACYICVREDSLPNHAEQRPGLEAEQVTLLPPGAPPNYVDLSISGTGLPPPPPDYELMISEEPKRSVQPELIQEDDSGGVGGYCDYGDGSVKYGNGSLKYNEVTYAELNTCNLPMRTAASSQLSSCSDDQVIYSQIVGTVSSQYSTQRSYTEPNNV